MTAEYLRSLFQLSLPMGVKEMPNGRFQARISVNKKHLALGTHATPEAASMAYQAARRQHFGEFA